MSKPRKPSATANTARGATFVNYSPAEAQGAKDQKGNARWLATDIATQNLVTTAKQSKEISDIHHCRQTEDHNFNGSSEEDQRIANALLARYGLDTASLNDLRTRWSRRWYWSSKGAKADERYERILYQWYVPWIL